MNAVPARLCSIGLFIVSSGAVAHEQCDAPPSDSRVEQISSAKPMRSHCVPTRADSSSSVFYNVAVDESIVREIAKVAPAAASALLNFRASSDRAPPVDMRSGDVSFEFVPTPESVAAKFDRDWEAVKSLQMRSPAGEYLSVSYASEMRRDGAITLTLESAWKRHDGTERSASPTVVLVLVPAGGTPLALPLMSDRTSPTMKVDAFVSVPAS